MSLQDERFNCEIDSQTGYRTKALLCMPIKDSGGDVIGVAQVINKMNGECFSEIDEKVSASESFVSTAVTVAAWHMQIAFII